MARASGWDQLLGRMALKEGRLTEEEYRVLNYFWNDKRQTAHKSMIDYVVEFLEFGRLDRTPTSGDELHVQSVLDSVVKKKFLTVNNTSGARIFSLTTEGAVLLVEEHPRWRRWLARWEVMTKEVRTLVGWFVALVAGSCTIIGFVLARFLD